MVFEHGVGGAGGLLQPDAIKRPLLRYSEQAGNFSSKANSFCMAARPMLQPVQEAQAGRSSANIDRKP